jgi:hypothetical protein
MCGVHVGHGRLQGERPILDAHGGEHQRSVVEQLLVEAGVELLAQDDINGAPNSAITSASSAANQSVRRQRTGSQ